MYGLHVHEAVLASGDLETGVTIHLVDADYDTGPVLAQCRVPVQPGDSVTELAARVQAREREFVVETLARIAEGTLSVGSHRKQVPPGGEAAKAPGAWWSRTRWWPRPRTRSTEPRSLRVALSPYLFRGMLVGMGAVAVGHAPRDAATSGLAWRFAKARARTLERMLGVRVTVTGREHVAGGGPFVFTPNHQSHLDILALLGSPARARRASPPSRSLWRHPVVGARARLARHGADRPRAPRRSAIAALESRARARRQSFVVFPEGGAEPRRARSSEFKKGAFVLAIRLGLPVVPVVCRGTRRLMPRGSRLTVVPGRRRDRRSSGRSRPRACASRTATRSPPEVRAVDRAAPHGVVSDATMRAALCRGPQTRRRRGGAAPDAGPGRRRRRGAELRHLRLRPALVPRPDDDPAGLPRARDRGRGRRRRRGGARRSRAGDRVALEGIASCGDVPLLPRRRLPLLPRGSGSSA